MRPTIAVPAVTAAAAFNCVLPPTSQFHRSSPPSLNVSQVVFGLYGAQMLLVPDFVMTQNFKSRPVVDINPASRWRELRDDAEL